MNKKNKQILCFIMAVIVLIAIFLVIIIKNRPIIDQNTNENTENQQEIVKNNDSTTKKEQPKDEKKDSESYYTYDLDVKEFDSTTEINTKDDSNNEKSEKTVESIDVDLNLIENPGYALMTVRCYFNPDIFTFETIKNGKVHPYIDENPVIQSDKYGTFFLIYLDYTGENIAKKGNLAKIHFSVKKNAKYEEE